MIFHRSIRRFAAFALLVAASTFSPLQAQDNATSKAIENARASVAPERLQAARDLMSSIGMDEQFRQVIPVTLRSVSQTMTPMFKQLLPDEEAREEFEDVYETILTEIENEFLARTPELIELTAVTYARVLSVDDMKAMAEFSNSAVGKKFSAATPEFMAEIMPPMMQVMMGQPLPPQDEVAPEKMEAAKRLFEASNMDELFQTMMKAQMTQNFGEDADPAATAAARQMMQKMSDYMIKRREDIYQIVAVGYAKRFSVDEMQEVASFYTTEYGRNIVDSMPKLVVEQQNVSQDFMREMMGDLNKRLEKALKDRGVKL